MSIKNNFDYVMNKIKITALKVNRNPDDIKLVAVSKYVDIDKMKEAVEIGLDSFGESKAQNFSEKYNTFKDDVKWHFIGHLQKNKVKYVIGKVSLIHSVDSLDLIKEIDKKAKNIGIDKVNILIQVNISEEKTKSGILKESVKSFINSAKNYNSVNIKGLMTMAPYTDNTENVRYVFRGLKECFDELKKEFVNNNCSMEYLSMGMSNDFEVAIEEGANILRLGSIIFK